MDKNILVTGTPGVGKSRLCREIAKLHPQLNYIDVSKLAKDKQFEEGFDDVFECPIIDEEELLDYLEPIILKGGNILEYHSCEFFPERFFQAVFVVRCDNTILYDRLTDRGYNPKKLQSNIECEIFQTVLDEAMDSYDSDIVFELRGDSEADFKDSLDKIQDWLEKN